MLMTVCYIEKDDEILMLHRIKKENDVNHGKWIGVGGKFEKGETPIECVKREIVEETGLIAKKLEEKGIVVFNYNDNPSEYMYLYSCTDFEGELIECNEGDLKWIKKEELLDLNLWEGDKIFHNLLINNAPYFFLTLNYNNDDLTSYELEYRNDGYSKFEVFVPEDYVLNIVESLEQYNLLTVGCYGEVYALIDVEGHWTCLEGANPFDGEIGKHSTAKEKMMKFIIKKEFVDLAYYLIKKAHPYEVPVINIY